MLRSPPIAKAMNQSRSETDLIKLYEDEQSHELSSPHITQRAKKRAFSPCAKKLGKSVEEIDYRTELRDMMNQFIASQNARLETLEAHILELKQHCTKIETSNNGMASSLNGLSDQITSLESKITGLDRQRAEMCSHLSALDEKIDTLERNMIKTCVEIRNVPLRQTETKQDLYGSVAVLSNCLGIDTKSDIRDISRYRIDKKSNSSALILEFSNTLIKSKFLDSVKSYNKKNPNQKLDSTNLGFTTKLKREGNVCTVKAKICPEHKVHGKLYGVSGHRRAGRNSEKRKCYTVASKGAEEETGDEKIWKLSREDRNRVPVRAVKYTSREQLFLGCSNTEGSLPSIGEVVAWEAIPMPISTRGVGTGTVHLAKSVTKLTPAVEVDVRSIYRPGLGLVEARVARQQGLFNKPNPLSHYSHDLEVSNLFIQTILYIPMVPEPFFRLVNCIGVLRHQGDVYLPVLPKEKYIQGSFMPNCSRVTLSNLRKTVVAMADPRTPRVVRDDFYRNSPKPGARWKDINQSGLYYFCSPEELVAR
ncbi:hypothetical protein PYW07_006723 [Mythimna separata]|uniref:Uncharacterized protein n=1 Tax=Mythimna separata TaxID=271217 RepID=A0AAD7YU43_MYTSE|nr:hypothetical protein PYW07_006723 [Mythimna separata]